LGGKGHGYGSHEYVGGMGVFLLQGNGFCCWVDSVFMKGLDGGFGLWVTDLG